MPKETSRTHVTRLRKELFDRAGEECVRLFRRDRRLEVEKEKEVTDENFVRGLMGAGGDEVERVLGADAAQLLFCKNAREQLLCEYHTYKIYHFVKLFHDIELVAFEAKYQKSHLDHYEFIDAKICRLRAEKELYEESSVAKLGFLNNIVSATEKKIYKDLVEQQQTKLRQYIVQIKTLDKNTKGYQPDLLEFSSEDPSSEDISRQLTDERKEAQVLGELKQAYDEDEMQQEMFRRMRGVLQTNFEDMVLDLKLFCI